MHQTFKTVEVSSDPHFCNKWHPFTIVWESSLGRVTLHRQWPAHWQYLSVALKLHIFTKMAQTKITTLWILLPTLWICFIPEPRCSSSCILPFRYTTVTVTIPSFPWNYDLISEDTLSTNILQFWVLDPPRLGWWVESAREFGLGTGLMFMFVLHTTPYKSTNSAFIFSGKTECVLYARGWIHQLAGYPLTHVRYG